MEDEEDDDDDEAEVQHPMLELAIIYGMEDLYVRRCLQEEKTRRERDLRIIASLHNCCGGRRCEY